MLIALVNNICTWIFICFMTFSTPPTLKNIAPCLIHSYVENDFGNFCAISILLCPFDISFPPSTNVYRGGISTFRSNAQRLPPNNPTSTRTKQICNWHPIGQHKADIFQHRRRCTFLHRCTFQLIERKILAYFVFFREFMDFLMYLLQAYKLRWCTKIDKHQHLISNGPVHNQHTVNKGGLHIYIPITCVAPSSKSIFNSNSSNTDFQPQPARSLVVYFRTAKVSNPMAVVYSQSPQLTSPRSTKDGHSLHKRRRAHDAVGSQENVRLLELQMSTNL